jgi:hypothetical protein
MARNGTEAFVFVMPDCDIHKYDKKQPGVPAVYDAKTSRGPWAYMCQSCFNTEAMFPDLGTGKGQRLVLKNGSA